MGPTMIRGCASVAMTTCRECRAAVAGDAPTCPQCGTPAPATRTEDQVAEEARQKAETDAFGRKFAIGCLSVFVGIPLLVGLLTWAAGDDGPDAPDPALEGAGAEVACEDFLREKLKSPASARFTGTTVASTGERSWRVSGTVDAANSFGAELRRSWTCTVRLEADTYRGSATLLGE
jgi:hypothetical protein